MARGISPESNGSANLGSSTQRWGKVFANRIDEETYTPGAFNKAVTYTSSGSFVAPVTGVYRITLRAGGGGGSGAGTTANGTHCSGGGGGEGGFLIAYDTLVAGTSYSFTIGAGGTGGTAGSATASTGGAGGEGGSSTITIGDNVYQAVGAFGGFGHDSFFGGGAGRYSVINTTGTHYKSCSGCGGNAGSNDLCGGSGGGEGGSTGAMSSANFGQSGGGGGGGRLANGVYGDGQAGGDGYITFEYYDPTL